MVSKKGEKRELFLGCGSLFSLSFFCFSSSFFPTSLTFFAFFFYYLNTYVLLIKHFRRLYMEKRRKRIDPTSDGVTFM